MAIDCNQASRTDTQAHSNKLCLDSMLFTKPEEYTVFAMYNDKNYREIHVLLYTIGLFPYIFATTNHLTL
jgi:hypothetical protein